MAKKHALDWQLAPAPESADHVKINAQYELYRREVLRHHQPRQRVLHAVIVAERLHSLGTAKALTAMVLHKVLLADVIRVRLPRCRCQ